jgi:putative transposase
MLSQEELESWYGRCGILAATRLLIDRIRSSHPARRVQAGGSNVCGRYPSRKMGVTIQFESHRVELAAIYEMEHDADVLEYYDQPPPLKLSYDSANGRRMGIIHTPDFFVLRATEAGWEEWKAEQDLAQLTEHNPNRYSPDGPGRWRCPPGEAEASALGVYYRVRSSCQINWTYQRNIQFLEDYLRAESSSVDYRIRQTVLALVADHPGISLSELFRIAEGSATRDDIYMLIASGVIQTDLACAPLVHPELSATPCGCN